MFIRGGFILAVLLLPACASFWQPSGKPATSLAIDLSSFNNMGLYGPPDGLRSLSYEFCIPADTAILRRIETIDVKARVYRSSPGRIGCNDHQWLMISDTHRPDYRKVLGRLAAEPVIDKIAPVWFE
ncbi:hypothetical protein EDC56_0320 [Sinobacterium caligoides]|uniref:Lipoprotein n=1 Tax=Sinobacterium caligoides TaxID=933926 RepID=A0A3N2DYG1_9GAMM|nr:hypothetical protein [Sinobacterium caligoides]ROS04807.1 hypothetical protein EDC56_0320 [Sinobacterium caligoides]